MKKYAFAGIVGLVVLAVAVSPLRPKYDPYAQWQGTIRGVLVGGSGLVIEAHGTGTLVEAYWSGDGPAPITSGSVEIFGRTTGTSCAYLATVFSQCHPEVEITQLIGPMRITSTAFSEGGSIPTEFTCDGAGTPPPLSIADVPAGAVSLSLVVTDPDAPRGTFTHWVLNDLAPDTATITTRDGFKPPCPPSGTHHYIFTLTARDGAGDVIATAQLTGIYSRSRP